jgi:thioredoxin-like negative regulator of GroEL
MSVDRLSKKALQKILSGKIKEPAICVVKFYSNSCDLCHNLKDEYEEIATQYEDVYFFAFNLQDYPTAEKVLGFEGVPTISLIKTGGYKPKIRVLKDPEKPYENMWYDPKDIIEFIEKEK